MGEVRNKYIKSLENGRLEDREGVHRITLRYVSSRMYVVRMDGG